MRKDRIGGSDKSSLEGKRRQNTSFLSNQMASQNQMATITMVMIAIMTMRRGEWIESENMDRIEKRIEMRIGVRRIMTRVSPFSLYFTLPHKKVKT